MTTRIRSGLRIPYDMNTKLIILANKTGISKNALVLQVLQEWIKKEGVEKWLEKKNCSATIWNEL